MFVAWMLIAVLIASDARACTCMHLVLKMHSPPLSSNACQLVDCFSDVQRTAAMCCFCVALCAVGLAV